MFYPIVNINLLKPRLKEGVEELPGGLDEPEAVNQLVEYNVDRQVEFLRESGEIDEDVDIIGVVYDFQDVYSGSRGEVHIINFNGENRAEKLREQNPEIHDRIERISDF